ncbi:MAG: hypothetical protein PHV07_06105 [Oscillospiraceae bacterium]|nr:hypothetical protein [Oscillospiraceae bacterium]
MDNRNTNYKIELIFSDKLTLKQLLTELLIQKFGTFDSGAPPV